jgi:Flp pilus assembly protein TadB
MLDYRTYTILMGLAVTALALFLYYRLSLTAKEIEKRRMEAQEKAQERLRKITRIGWHERLQKEAWKSGWDLTLKDYLFISGGAFLVTLILSIALKNIFLAVFGGVIAYLLPRYIIRVNRKKEYKLKVKLLKPALQAIASAHSFKPNIVSAIQHAVGAMQDPIKRDFELLLADIETGMPLHEALNGLRQRVNVKYLDFFIKVVLLAEEEGGKTYELIKTCAEMIDQEMLVMEEFETEVAAEKKTTYQLLLLQYVMLGFLSLTQPAAFAGYTTTLFGRLFLVYIFGASVAIYYLLEKYTDTSLEEVS